MAKPLSILKGTKAELVFTHDSSQASDVLFAQWQVSVSALVGASEPKSFFDKLAVTTIYETFFQVRKVVARVPVLISPDFNILEILATFGYKNLSSDGENKAAFFIADNNAILSETDLSASSLSSVAGSSVLRRVFSPGLHVFTLEVEGLVNGFGSPLISIAGGEGGSTALYIRQMKA
jgi:hypothetical protein